MTDRNFEHTHEYAIKIMAVDAQSGRNTKGNRTRLLSFLAIAAAIGFCQGASTAAVLGPQGPQFKADGQLVFLKHGTRNSITMITIQIAANDSERAEGLMWRQSMPENDGMLFIFGDEQPLSFWMKNTYIPLDMVFADKSGRIVNIYADATPLSEASISSGEPAKYVVEVNAGFCSRYGIQTGDRIEFER